MFTGIVTDIGEVASVESRGELRRLRICCGYAAEGIALGASIACNGVCLTVVAVTSEAGRTMFDVDAGAETLRLTTAADWRAGTRINLERALKIGDELGGHIVTGHVDGVAKTLLREDFDSMTRFRFETSPALARFVAQKGSVALDGVSLTVNSVQGNEFSVLLIPHTLAMTNLHERNTGDALNLEVDLMARYAARLTEKP